jgi:tetratricopeptide (TPR) repeat protein
MRFYAVGTMPSPRCFASGSVWALALIVALPATAHAQVTFTKDIAPIVFSRCATCHHPDGSAPFSLLTYAEVKRRATQIALATKSRFMPPWKANAPDGEFIGQHPLTDGEIAAIQQWAEQGAVEGDPRDLPAPPASIDGWQLGKPDLVVGLSRPYTLQADGKDVFRIFVIPLPLDAARSVKGLEFRPGNPKVVHHADIRLDRTPTSRRYDDEDPAPGYDGLLARSAAYPEGHLLGWAPGQIALPLPTGLAWRLDPGTDLVVQLHMKPSGRPEPVEMSIGLWFTDEPSARTPGMLRLGRQTIDIPAGAKDYTLTDSFVLPVDVEVQAVQPHAHYRAREIRGIATLPNGTTRSLIHIKDWDFTWQQLYRFAKPFMLPKDTTITMRYTYDNSTDNPRNPELPPRRVFWGQQSSDEMGDLWIQVLTKNDRDLAALNGALRPKMIAEDIAGYEMAIRSDATSVALHDDVAQLYLELGRTDRAIAHFETSTKLAPDSAPAHFNYGIALTAAGRLDEAIAQYRLALAIRPDYALAHTNLSYALVLQGKIDEAIQHYRAALTAEPGNLLAHNSLGSVLLQRGEVGEALSHFHDALRADPASVEAHYNLGRAYRERGELSEAITHFRQTVQLDPGRVPALVDLAWLLAAASDAAVRAPTEAISLAERAADLTRRGDVGSLDVLGAAYAAAGLFDRAVDATEEALGLAPQGSLASRIRERQELYLARQPYRLPARP